MINEGDIREAVEIVLKVMRDPFAGDEMRMTAAMEILNLAMMSGALDGPEEASE